MVSFETSRRKRIKYMIVIKTNLEKIPNKCSECEYHREYCDDSCSCKIINNEVYWWTCDRPDWCPLQEVEDIVDKDVEDSYGNY